MHEQRRDLMFVSLKLVESRPDAGVFIRGIFQFNDAQWQAVNEDHHVRPPVMLPFDDCELVDRVPIIVFWLVVVQEMDNLHANAPIFSAALHGDSVHQQPVKFAIVHD